MPSTAISRIVYDEDSRVMSVWFVESGQRYDYIDVPPHAAAAFRRAPSKGRHFVAFVRDRYDFKRVA